MNIKGGASLTAAPPKLQTQSLGSKIRGAMNLSSNASASEAHQAAALARKQALDEIHATQMEVQEARVENAAEIDQLREENAVDLEVEQAKHEQNYQNMRNESHRRLRELSHSINQEIQQIKNVGEKQSQETRALYDQEIQNIAKNKERELTELQLGQMQMMEQETLKSDHQIRNLQTNNERQKMLIQEQTDEQINSMHRQSQEKLTHDRERFAEQSQRAESFFNQSYLQSVANHENRINQINQEASKELQTLKETYTNQLNAYSERADDPFYQSMTLGATLDEENDEYILRARVPAHEQDGVAVTVSGDQLIVSGRRHFSESTDLPDGQKRSTSAFQSYTESYPLPYPVESRSLSKTFEGDEMIIKVLKKPLAYQAYQGKVARPEPIRAERPKFPDDLMKIQKSKDPDEEPQLAKATPASLPLDSDLS